MKIVLKYILIIILMWGIPMSSYSQRSSTGNRTPELEALKQTEKYQKELDLSAEQVKIVYDINLKYARERQQSNNRTEAVNRMKKKNEEISKVLNYRQNLNLQNKRSQNQSVEIAGKRNFTRTKGLVNLNNSTPKSNYRRDANAQNRPVRPMRISPASRENTNSRENFDSRETVRGGNRPVRIKPQSNSRSSSSISNRERTSPPRNTRSGARSNVRKPENSHQSNTSTPRNSESSSQRSTSSGSHR